MSDYSELVKALRLCQFGECGCGKCYYKELKGDWCTEDNHPEFFDCDDKLKLDSAAAIEDLQAKISELGESYSANLVAAQNAQLHWASVEDELPEPNIQCLVRDDDCNYAVGYYRQDVKAWDSPFFGWLERDDEYYEDGDLCRIGKVVAWMPLPEPPKEDADADK